MRGTMVGILVALLLGCGQGCASPTTITVDVYTDLACQPDSEVSLTLAPSLVELAESAASTSKFGCDAEGHVGSVVVVPVDDREKTVALAVATHTKNEDPDQCVRADRSPGCILSRRQLRFAPNQDLRLRIDLRPRCEDVGCPATQTCVRGECLDADVTGQCEDGCDEDTLNLIVNGFFENGPKHKPGSFLFLPKGSSDLPGWTIGGNSIDVHGNLQVVDGGKFLIDLNGGGKGSISQSFATTAGADYRVSFLLAGNPCEGAGEVIRRVRVSVAGTSSEYAFDSTGRTKGNMGWTRHEFDFTADAGSTTLTFESLVGTVCGPALDAVVGRKR